MDAAPIIAILKPIIIIGVVLLGIKFGIHLLVWRKKTPVRRKNKNSPTYEKQEHLLTPAELKFYRVLKEAVGDDYQIMCQVSLSQILQTRPMNPSERQTAFNKINGKVLDFVLCDPNNLAIVAAIELDDSSHKRKDRIARDQFLNEAMEEAGVPLLRFQVQSSYTTDQIAQKIAPLQQSNAT